MYKVLKRTWWAIVLPIRSFVFPCPRCRRRRGLLKVPIILPPETEINGSTRPPAVNEEGSRFPGRSNPLQTHVYFQGNGLLIFFISIAQWSVEEDDTIMSKVAKGKGRQDKESTNSFQNYDSRRLLMFLYQGWYLQKEKETSF